MEPNEVKDVLDVYGELIEDDRSVVWVGGGASTLSSSKAEILLSWSARAMVQLYENIYYRRFHIMLTEFRLDSFGWLECQTKCWETWDVRRQPSAISCSSKSLNTP
jgi:hypothetical protein